MSVDREVPTDIRDRSLATCTDPPYLWGRLLAAYETVNRHWFTVVPSAEPRKTAVDNIRENGGYCPAGFRVRLEEEYLRAMKQPTTANPLSGERRATIEALVAELTPTVDEQLHGRRLTEAEESQMLIGFHHQRDALHDLPNTRA